jgi:sugar phosphate isomerase/epimerase
MRLGGPVPGDWRDVGAWVNAHKTLGYTAAYVPGMAPDDAKADEIVSAARAAGLVLAEVGAWSNPISTDTAEREKAFKKCCDSLALADRVGARCCVNIAGSRGPKWDGPHATNLDDATFQMIVECVRKIIDTVKPTRTFYTLETMPWIAPDSADSYLRLIRAIDRKQFGVHLDPVNTINSPERIFRTGPLLKECFEKLGPHIRSCHAKDITIGQNLTVHLDECIPGTGYLDYATYLREAAKLDADTPIMLEHLPSKEQYATAAAHLRKVAKEEGLVWK